jgi:ABC-2 type transport system permease protein
MVRQVEYNGHKAFLRKFDDMIHDPGEQEITTAFKRLITGPSKIAFVTGHNERDIHKKGDRDYKLLTNTLSYRNSLINQGFDAQSVTLDKEIPGDISALVIAGPTTPYSGEELRKIQHYIAAGGNVMICGDAGVQAVLNPVTGPLGVRFTDGTLMRDNKDAAQDYVLAGFTPAVQKYPDSYAGEYKGGRKVLMEGAAGLTYKNGDGFFADTLLMADTSGTWIKAGEFRLDTGKIRYDPARGDTKGAACVALALTRERAGKQQRIIILGDADFMSNADLRKDVLGPAANYGFAYDIFQWFSYGVYPIALPRPNGADNKLLMTEGGLIWFKIIFFGVIPGLLLLSGTVLLITRNRK